MLPWFNRDRREPIGKCHTADLSLARDDYTRLPLDRYMPCYYKMVKIDVGALHGEKLLLKQGRETTSLEFRARK
jgi:hypothetical protein